jgi:hypothetical protein
MLESDKTETETEIIAVQRAIAEQKQLAKSSMHDKAAMATVVQRLRELNTRLVELQYKLTPRDGIDGLGEPKLKQFAGRDGL